MSDIIRAIKPLKLAPKVREKLYKKLIPIFEEYDCDTLMECVNDDVAFDSAMRKLNPDDFEAENED